MDIIYVRHAETAWVFGRSPIQSTTVVVPMKRVDSKDLLARGVDTRIRANLARTGCEEESRYRDA